MNTASAVFITASLACISQNLFDHHQKCNLSTRQQGAWQLVWLCQALKISNLAFVAVHEATE
jgi:hypothetical protein